MSKDKGSKNVKKAPVDKSLSKKKDSSYKDENKSKQSDGTPPKQKSDTKVDKNQKP